MDKNKKLRLELDHLDQFENDNSHEEPINLDDDRDNYYQQHPFNSQHIKKKLSYEEEQIARGR